MAYGDDCHDVIISGLAPDRIFGGTGSDACKGSSCEVPETTPITCRINSDCVSGQRCVPSNGLCVPQSADACEDGASSPPDAGMDAGPDAAMDASIDASLPADAAADAQEASTTYITLTTHCGVGACGATGQTACSAGAVRDSCQAKTGSVDDTTCNGVDDDCDGQSDEDFIAATTHCGVGACSTSGVTSCVAGQVIDSCAPLAAAVSDATCDGIDNNCNGQVDEQYVSVNTSCGVGACAAHGVTSCVAGGVQDSCHAGAGALLDDSCNGVDDDCDGSVDEEYASVPTFCGAGVCAATGATACVDGQVRNSCVIGPSGGVDSDCDGLDDDCDGVTDDEFQPSTVECGVGACRALGQVSCAAGVLHNSCVAQLPSSTVDALCDGIDEDCDGSIDEDFQTSVVSCGVGACASTGALSCAGGAIVNTCQAKVGAASDTTCNGVDDDCDGGVDEEFAVTQLHCGVGACAATGARECRAGSVVESCTAGLPSVSDATCDGRDDDCDGAIDEDATSARVQCGTGACAVATVRSCVAGQWIGACQPAAPTVHLDTVCNGIDDDCDGAVDEDFQGSAVSCGAGVCVNKGQTTCVSGTIVQECTPYPALSNRDDVCDGVDSDCDGAVDEEVVSQPTTCGAGACARGGVRACVAGQLTDSCAAPNGTANDASCNGIDDDCDGQVDEDFSGACTGTTAQICVGGQLVSSVNCDDGFMCNGGESCSNGKCVRTPLNIDDNNPCPTDSCSESGGIAHTDLPFGATCSDGNACNGIEVCVPCMESENLLTNASFERVWTPNLSGQGYVPTDWWTTYLSADTYSFDNSWGLGKNDFGNFTNVTSVPDGVRWVAGASWPESFAQELRKPLVTGQRYRIAAKLHQAARSDLSSPGGYEVYLSSDYAFTGPQLRQLADVKLGRMGTTTATQGWVDVSLEFTAPANISDRLLLNLVPYSQDLSKASYPGIDVIRLVKACSGSGAQSCQRQDAPTVDDGLACTQDSCSAVAGVTHTPLSSGSACNGTGTCGANGACSNGPPVITNTPPPYHVAGTGNCQYQVTATDPDGDPITFTRLSDAQCGWTITPAGLVTLANPSPAVCVLSIQAADSRGAVTKQRKLFQILKGEPTPPMVPEQPTQHFLQPGTTFNYDIKVWQQNLSAPVSFVFETTPPEGMTLSAQGRITWTPDAQDLGTHEVSVRVSAAGSTFVHSFSLSVIGSAGTPTFSSKPATRVLLGESYAYQAYASSDGHQLAIQGEVLPAGMTLNSATGLVSWTPSATQIGQHQVALSASSGTETALQQFTIDVVGVSNNLPPVLAPLCVPGAIAGKPWTLDLEAYDPEGTAVSYFATGLPQGATINSTTGLINWTPGSAYANQTISLRLGARDATGLTALTDLRLTIGSAATPATNRHRKSRPSPATTRW